MIIGITSVAHLLEDMELTRIFNVALTVPNLTTAGDIKAVNHAHIESMFCLLLLHLLSNNDDDFQVLESMKIGPDADAIAANIKQVGFNLHFCVVL